MAKIGIIGLKSLKLGDVANDGGMGALLESWGYTFKQSCKMETSDPTITKFRAEEVDGVIASIAEEGDITIKWQIVKVNADILKKAFGGEVSGSGTVADPKKWDAPSSMPNIEKSIELTPKIGGVIQIPRASITAKINYEASSQGIFLIDVTAEVMVPEKEGVVKMSYIEPGVEA